VLRTEWVSGNRVFRFRVYNTVRSLERGVNCIIGAGNYERCRIGGSMAAATAAAAGDVNIQ